jgi:hydroxyethylthiazole kinase
MRYLDEIRKKKPLIHHITNYVVANETANLTLCLGALPVMAHAIDEVEEMVEHAQALVLNIGTLDRTQIDAMLAAGARANERGVPVVLDPVGAGATQLRTDAAREIAKNVRLAAIRGNAAEVSILAGYRADIAGVEALGAAENIERVIKELALKLDCVVCATGPIDHVSDGRHVARVANGHPMLSTVTGTGCMCTTVVASHIAVAQDRFDAAVHALAAFGIAGEHAAAEADRKPGTFHQELYNAVFALTDDEVDAEKRVEILREE